MRFECTASGDGAGPWICSSGLQIPSLHWGFSSALLVLEHLINVTHDSTVPLGPGLNPCLPVCEYMALY